jgi:hypothetical protein
MSDNDPVKGSFSDDVPTKTAAGTVAIRMPKTYAYQLLLWFLCRRLVESISPDSGPISYNLWILPDSNNSATR